MVIKDLTKEAVQRSIRATLDDVENRRTRERYDNLNYYEGMVSNMEQDIMQYFDSDSLRQTPPVIEGITSKIIDSRCKVHLYPIERQADDRYNDYIQDLDSALLQLERLTYLLGTMAMKCYWDEEKQKVNYQPLVEFYPIFLDGKEDPVACMYPLYNHSTKSTDQVFAFWSDEDHYLISGDGKIFYTEENPEGLNPYGKKPIFYSHTKPLTTDWFREGASDIVNMNRTINIMLTEMSLAMRLQMLGQPVISGVDLYDSSKLRLGADKPIVISEGDFKFEAPGGNLGQYIEAMRFLVDSTAYNHSLKTKWSVGREAFVSGESLKMAEMELTQSVMLDAQMVWKPLEYKRYEIERAIIEYEAGVTLDEELSVDYQEPVVPLTAQEERADWEFKWKHGLASKKDWYRVNNPDAPDETVEEIMDQVTEEGTPQGEEVNRTRLNLSNALNVDDDT